MDSLPIRWIDIRSYAHATEDEARVDHALEFVCPEGETAREVLEGHFGNALVRLTRRLAGRREIAALWEHWSMAGLAAAIRADIDARVDEEGILHFRLDKQAAYLERLILATEADPIDVRVKLVAYPAKAEEARRVARSIVQEAA